MQVFGYASKAAKARPERISFELSEPGPREVDIRVEYCGICHSDIAMMDNDWGWSSYPFVGGHEAIGVVERVGKEVTLLKPGVRVGLGWQCGSCGACEQCRRGQEHFCAGEKDTIVGRYGGFASHVRADERFAVPIPEGVDPAKAGPLMCAGSTVYGPIAYHGVTGGMRVAVVGVGGLGHLAVQMLAKLGADVTAISSTHDKDDQARKLGATHFIATKAAGELEKAKNSFDFVLCTASGSVDWDALMATLRPRGKFVLVGLPESAVTLSPVTLITGERSFHGGRATSPMNVADMLRFVARTGVEAVTEEFPMSEINTALDRVRSGKVRWRAVLKA